MLVTEIERSAEGQPAEVIARWADEFGSRLLRAAVVMCGNPADAEDLLQETLLQAFRNVNRFRGNSGPYTWLYAILRHQFLTRRRKARFLEFLSLLPDRPDETPSVEQRLGRESTHKQVRDALSRLSFRHREILFLRYVEELKIREMATLLGLPTGSVKSRLHSAVNALQKRVVRDRRFAPEGRP